VVDYYARIAPVLLPHMGDRAMTLRRFPNGVDAGSFFEKNCPKHRPPWVATFPIAVDDGTIEFCRLDSVAALVWCANLAALELHAPMARGGAPDRPTLVVFDLDPGAPADILDCAEVGLWVRHVLSDLGLECLVKTSGSKGLQVYLPLNTPATHQGAADFARTIAQVMEQQHADRVVSQQRKSLREGKVLIDWSQNSRHKTTACAYTLRARPRPTVSTPVSWEEVEAALDAGDPGALSFEAPEVLDRVADAGDLFAPALSLRQALPALA
jgi:bifunctional non-homologous end joining protein LigD